MTFPAYPKYKDSGVEWLGPVPTGWSVDRIKNRSRLVTEKASERVWPVALENIESWSGKLVETESEYQGEGISFHSGDVLFGKLRPYLAKVYAAERNGEAVGDFHVLRPDNNTATQFLTYQLLTREIISLIDGSTYGAKMPRASWDFVANIKLAFPPLPEQAAIAAFLDRETAKIDDLVAEQRRLIELLKEKHQAVISHAVTKGLNPDAPMKDSGIPWLGQVPEHWEVVALKRVCSLLKDGTHLPPKRVDNGIRLLSVRNIIELSFTFRDDDSMISEEDYMELCKAFIPVAGDVLLAIVGATLGKTAIVPENIDRFHIQRSLAIFRPIDSIEPQWLFHFFQSVDFQRMLWSTVAFSAQPGVYLGTLSSAHVVLPPQDERSQILAMLVNLCTELHTLTIEAETAITLLQERRAALISAAVTGKIDVRTAAKNQEAAA